ncbi:MAG: hypothetical protein ACYTAS_16730 [Planctomycetota bacterium]|jgi:hypothetical protein
MQSQGIVHFLLFVVFFSIGAAALGGAVLCDDLILYCQNRQLVREAERSLERLESLNREYDALLAQLERDPNLLKRIAPATLGTEPEDPNAVYPRARARELALARKALLDQAGEAPPEEVVPHWLQRCSEPSRKLGLFVAGAGLVLISLVLFTPKPQRTH